MVSHDNILYAIEMVLEVIHIEEKTESTISYLPLSHVAAQVRSLGQKISVSELKKNILVTLYTVNAYFYIYKFYPSKICIILIIKQKEDIHRFV